MFSLSFDIISLSFSHALALLFLVCPNTHFCGWLGLGLGLGLIVIVVCPLLAADISVGGMRPGSTIYYTLFFAAALQFSIIRV